VAKKRQINNSEREISEIIVLLNIIGAMDGIHIFHKRATYKFLFQKVRVFYKFIHFDHDFIQKNLLSEFKLK